MYQTVYRSRSTAPDAVALKPEVLIIGGGVIGITVARELAREGMKIAIAEKGDSLGGGVLQLRSFFDRPTNVRKWIEEEIVAVERAETITVHRGVQLKRLDGHLGRFRAVIRERDGRESVLSPSVIVVATGCVSKLSDPLDSTGRVIGLSDMEELLSAGENAPLEWNGQPLKTVTFLLDRTNDDIKIHTVNAVKQAILLQEKGCQVAVVARDLKVSVSGMERHYRRAREKGVLFFKYEEPPVLSIQRTASGASAYEKISVEIPDFTVLRNEERETVTLLADLLVISETFTADPSAAELCRRLGIRPGVDGMLMDDNPQLQRISSNRRGIFVVGACRFPQIITESLSEAHAVVQEVKALFAKGQYVPANPVAEVDTGKCAVCYTCVRLCPHAAITMEKYGERNVYAPPTDDRGISPWGAARVEPTACFGCGVCIAECPAKAITLYRQD